MEPASRRVYPCGVANVPAVRRACEVASGPGASGSLDKVREKAKGAAEPGSKSRRGVGVDKVPSRNRVAATLRHSKESRVDDRSGAYPAEPVSLHGQPL